MYMGRRFNIYSIFFYIKILYFDVKKSIFLYQKIFPDFKKYFLISKSISWYKKTIYIYKNYRLFDIKKSIEFLDMKKNIFYITKSMQFFDIKNRYFV